MEVVNIVSRDGSLSAEVKSGENSYVVIITDDPELYCSCLDAFMTKNGNCKHLKFLLERLRERAYMWGDVLNRVKE